MRVHLARLVLLVLHASWVHVSPAQAQRVLTAGTGGQYPTLHAAVAAALPGDTVAVLPGVYREPTLDVDKPLALVGRGHAVLDGEGQQTLVRVTGSGVMVRGFTFRNVGGSFVEDRAALLVEDAEDCTIAANTFEATFFGIYLARTTRCTLTGNRLDGRSTRESTAGNGIHLWYSRHVTVEGNRIQGHRDGIYFEFVEDSEVARNVSTHNLRYGLHFMFSDRCRYERNTFQRNGAGVAVMYTKHVEMTRNYFGDNWGAAAFGLLLKDITDSRIAGNTFRANTVGLYAEGANRVEVTRNTFDRNGWAVKVMADAFANTFTANTFTANTFDVGTNSRQTSSTFAGNYWDAYRGYDLDRDGVGDVPFRPVRLFSLLVERYEPALLLTRSLFVNLLDLAERVAPVITPETLVDARPAMHPFVP